MITTPTPNPTREMLRECVDAQVPPPDGDPMTEFATLENERKALEDRLEQIAKRQAQLQETLTTEWLNRGIENMRIGNRTFYLAFDFYCNKRPEAPTDAINGQLRAMGLGHLVSETYNASGVKAFIKEKLAEEQADLSDNAPPAVPEELKGLFKWGEVARIRSRKV